MYPTVKQTLRSVSHAALFAGCAVALTLGGCAKSLNDDIDTDTETDTGPKVTIDGDFVNIDSSNANYYIYVAMMDASEVVPENPDDSAEWDLAFKRYTILHNGGISGTGGMEILKISDMNWDDVTEAPDGEYITDTDDQDGDGKPDIALNDWYDYNGDTHVLTPHDVFYAIRATDGSYYKFRVHDYYDEAGTSGHMKVEWADIDPPAGQ